jgi:hypothetical protein
MSRLADIIRERRRRQEGPDPLRAIFYTFINPVTKMESTDVPRMASVVGGPTLRQEPSESIEAFEARAHALAKRLRTENEQIN